MGQTKTEMYHTSNNFTTFCLRINTTETNGQKSTIFQLQNSLFIMTNDIWFLSKTNNKKDKSRRLVLSALTKAVCNILNCNFFALD